MTTVAEMIEFFKTLPQDAIVECGNDYFVSELDPKVTKVIDFGTEENRRLYRWMNGKKVVQLYGK